MAFKKLHHVKLLFFFLLSKFQNVHHQKNYFLKNKNGRSILFFFLSGFLLTSSFGGSYFLPHIRIVYIYNYNLKKKRRGSLIFLLKKELKTKKRERQRSERRHCPSSSPRSQWLRLFDHAVAGEPPFSSFVSCPLCPT